MNGLNINYDKIILRLVMEKTDHTFLVSQGAEKLADEEKLEKVRIRISILSEYFSCQAS